MGIRTKRCYSALSTNRLMQARRKSLPGKWKAHKACGSALNAVIVRRESSGSPILVDSIKMGI
jgi:hypothetical protein